jgi:hypothetical protein
MLITKETLTDMIVKYLNRKIDKVELVDWAEDMICNGEIVEERSNLIMEILGRLGLSDVKEFGLSWDDCYDYLQKLGHKVTVMVA